jgi:hypothetical protein
LANIIFDNAIGRWVEKFMLPIGGDNILVVLLKAAGLQADSVINDHATMATLLAANSVADFTNYSAKVLSAVDITRVVDTSTGVTTIDVVDQVWASAGGAVNNSLGALITCYRPTSSSPTSNWLPLTKHDYLQTSTGVNLQATIPSIGTGRWSAT